MNTQDILKNVFCQNSEAIDYVEVGAETDASLPVAWVRIWPDNTEALDVFSDATLSRYLFTVQRDGTKHVDSLQLVQSLARLQDRIEELERINRLHIIGTGLVQDLYARVEALERAPVHAAPND